MKIYDTSTLSPGGLNNTESLFVYNGLDTMVTREVFDVLIRQASPSALETYAFSRSLQGVVLDMNMRGLLVDEERRVETIRAYRQDIARLTENVNRLVRDGIGYAFPESRTRKYEWPSDDQLKTLFYDILGIPEIRKRNTNGDLVRTVDHDALERLEHYFYAEPIVHHIFTLRDLGKKVSFLSTDIDTDGRLRTSFNIAGTKTGRFASSFSDFGTGTNLQNIENRLRAVFISDPGYKFCNIDLEQADARVVGAIHWNLFRDNRYLDACESGDLHTNVARAGFPHLQWTDDPVRNRAIADGHFHRSFNYRDAAKRLGHGTNYQGQPDKMSRATHIQISNIIAFQKAYLKQFPAFPLWWDWVERQIRDVRRMTTLLGRQRYFFGHYADPDTIREAVAYEPQSVTADTINRGLLTVWRELGTTCQLLNQVHDSILFQFPEQLEHEIVPRALALVEQTITLKEGRPFTIPAAAKTGYNWSDYHPTQNPDPDALMKYPNTRKRVRGATGASSYIAA